MGSEMNKNITIIIFSFLLFVLVRLAIRFKIKRIISKSEYVRNNLNNKNVKKYISFLRMNTLINAPEIGQTLRETQFVVNRAAHVDGKLKLRLYSVLMRKRIIGIQEVTQVYADKNERNLAK